MTERPLCLRTRVFAGILRTERGKHVLLAMQKVEGSNPFSRFGKGLHLQAFSVCAVCWCGVHHAIVHVVMAELGPGRRETFAMSGEKSVEIRRPRSPRSAAAMNPVSPGPAPSSRAVSPGLG